MKKKWKTEDLMKALQSVHEGTSIGRAGVHYGIPRSTLSDYMLGKIDIGNKQFGLKNPWGRRPHLPELLASLFLNAPYQI